MPRFNSRQPNQPSQSPPRPSSRRRLPAVASTRRSQRASQTQQPGLAASQTSATAIVAADTSPDNADAPQPEDTPVTAGPHGFAARLASATLSPLEPGPRVAVDPEADNHLAYIHRVLLSVASEHPGVALFPWLIDGMSAGAATQIRGTPARTDDRRYAFSVSAFLSWPLNGASMRLGMFSTDIPAKKGCSRNDTMAHAWACAIIGTGRKGKRIVLYDPESRAHLEIQGRRRWFIQDILNSQIVLLKLCRKRGMKVADVWWGGYNSVADQPNACLEATLQFIERFCKRVKKAGYVVDDELLYKCRMEPIGWR